MERQPDSLDQLANDCGDFYLVKDLVEKQIKRMNHRIEWSLLFNGLPYDLKNNLDRYQSLFTQHRDLADFQEAYNDTKEKLDTMPDHARETFGLYLK